MNGAWPIRPPACVAIRVSERSRCGANSANSNEIIPPIETPTTWQRDQHRWSISAKASLAIWTVVYSSVNGVDDRPQPRLSNVTHYSNEPMDSLSSSLTWKLGSLLKKSVWSEGSTADGENNRGDRSSPDTSRLDLQFSSPWWTRPWLDPPQTHRNTSEDFDAIQAISRAASLWEDLQ